MKVLKFGGTSVGQPERMKSIARLIQDGQAKIVVLSALSGTTNTLVKIAQLLHAKDALSARNEIDQLHSHYQAFMEELYSTDEAHQEAKKTVEGHFSLLYDYCQKATFSNLEERIILSQGELLATKMFAQYLSEQGVESRLLPALNYMRIDEHNEPDLAYIRANLNNELNKQPQADIALTQGYICLNANNEVDNLRRGGSDYTASLIGAALKAEAIQIWTDIDGMHNNDPRVVAETRPIAELSFDEAAELAYFGAKILHPSSIQPAQRYNIPVQLKNTMDAQAPGTTITTTSGNEHYKAVAAKDGITAIKIKSSRMLLAYGFLRRIFEIFEKYRTPIDVITTSEVAVSLTIDNEDYLDPILRELQEFGMVEVDPKLSIVCIVGNMTAEQMAVMNPILQALEEVPLRMISYGGSRYNVSLLVKTADKDKALKALNKGLFGLEG